MGDQEYRGPERRKAPRRERCATCPLGPDGFCAEHKVEVDRRKTMKGILIWGLGTLGAAFVVALYLTVPAIRDASRDLSDIKATVQVVDTRMAALGRRIDDRLAGQEVRMNRIEQDVDRIQRGH